MSERWIVGVDGSDGALAAVRWAVINSCRADAEVTVVCAYHVPLTLSMLATRRGFDVDRLGMEAEAHHLLDEAVAAVGGPQQRIQTVAIEGQPSTALLDAAEDASLLIVGRRGGGGLRNLVLGSVSNYCATHADVPVVVVPAEWDSTSFQSSVVGFDGSANARAALRWTLAITPNHLPVEVVIAIEPAPWLSEEITLARYPDEVRHEERRINELADAVDPGGRATRHVRLHGPRQALADAAETADLLVVGARGHGRIGSALLGSVSSWLLHSAPCPIAVVPRSDQDD
jgi:nucleotide-binding universal stress UspA family protein